MNGRNWALLVLSLWVLIGGLWWGIQKSATSGDPPEMSYSKFLRELHADQIDQVHVRDRIAVGRGKDGKPFRVMLPYLDPQLADDIADHTEATFEEGASPELLALALFAAPLLLFLIVLALRWGK